MQDYEIRISTQTGAVVLIANGYHLHDFDAVRTAQKICRAGEFAEILRDDVCIYSDRPQRTIDQVWPISRKTVTNFPLPTGASH